MLRDFDEELFNSTVEKILVHEDGVVFGFRDGMKKGYIL